MVSREAWLLVLGYIAALGLGAYELRRAQDLSEPPPPPGKAAQPLPPLEIPPSTISSLAAYDAIVERPLFSPDRRPEAAAEDDIPSDAAGPHAKDAAIEVDGFRLTAVLRDSESTTVLIEDEAGQTRILHEGEQLGNWQLGEIQDDRVELVGDGRRKTLMVYDFSTPPVITAPQHAVRRTLQPRPAPTDRLPLRPPAIRR